MFNLLISADPECWLTSPVEFEKGRVAIEYTANEISERYKFFDEKAIDELMSFPTLFVTEGEMTESQIGYITNIRVRSNTIAIDYKIDKHFQSLPMGTIEEIRVDIDLGRWELSRTHWAIKNEDLFSILMNKGYVTAAEIILSKASRGLSIFPKPNNDKKSFNDTQVFIVHGHDELAKLDMANFISSIGLEPIILHMQPSGGKTIIEKIEEYTNVGFGVVLYTPCDIGVKKDSLNFSRRARQNVVFEHGYLIAKLGRSRVVAMVKGEIETPNDISGVVYIDFDDKDNWKEELLKEMRDTGYNV